MDFLNKILQGDVLEVLKTLPAESVDCIVTSPPYYGLRDYGVAGQIGLEKTLQEFISNMLLVTAELKRVLKKTGTLWWNHGDSYAGSASGKSGVGSTLNGGKTTQNSIAKLATTQKRRGGEIQEKSLLLQAHRLAIRMVDEQGWILRNQIIWHKPNVMPSSVEDRFCNDYEPIFFFTKSKKYWFEKQLEDSVTGDSASFNIRVRASAHGRASSSQYKATDKEIEKYNRKKFEKSHGGSGMGLHGHSGNFDPDGNYIGTPGKRGKRTVWKIATKPFLEAHFATFPPELIETPIKAGCPKGGVVLDPFMGAGTTAIVARILDRNYIGIELNPEYIKLAEKRLAQKVLNF